MSDFGGASLRLLRASDISAATQLSAQAAWNQTADDWRMLLELAPEGCLAIEVDGELAATTTLLCYGRRLAWIGMVLTKLQYRGRGLAKRLLAQALALADRMEIETVKLDATDQGKPIYGKLGFRPEQSVERWSRPGSARPGPSKPGPAAMPILSSAALPPEEWGEVDSRAYGADRSQLLQHLARRNPPCSFARSYLLMREGRQTAYLGPCVCSAPEIAQALIERAVQNADCAWSWDLLPNNASAIALARDLGFAPSRTLLRMVRGEPLRGEEETIYAIAGFELG
jgi:GNAT superfamily N-acetyltransferase